ncbi:preprotein translocase subunit SecG [Pseudomonas syringae]|uniref:preprotein translocase subunit SecG n=1 Tax=Pseudomonas syringae TaxID=317 RepID=UPI0002091662|nr:preprotein translocase subunit SecG [Pseudomonas syringae]EPN04100.1 preprotein translocase subunit SecG [Pseudomonas syringae pv. actinidiae ICMP 19070]AQL39436.1 preprotein translocase subunit SecG [Pseudomonas syringae pv. actinidiae ICMP 9853]EGH64232.1 preprotein translocase subunit SecG [Pseudomonas syringae pv. actinidiae str. M302091]EPM54472.1 preprotein translocase subunit SecG [Pseudomonas syringae pv. actinidiae ICMP 19103]EPM88385.1 preprotein translocase subunit SecG [Pseudomo
MLETVVIVFHLLGALGVVALVLLQQGKGADAGASFGAGASNTVFGGQGTSTFLSKFTAILAACFFITSLGLGYFAKEKAQQLTQVGLPDPAVLEVKQKRAASDVPVLEEQKPAVVPADAPQAPEKK